MIHNKKFLMRLLYATLCLSIAAAVFALVEFTITNLTLVCYSLSVPCVWKISSILSWQLGYLVEKELKQRKKFAFFLFLSASMYLFISILSLYSCVMLFPHPYIHKYLIGIIYSVGIINVFYIYYAALGIRQKNISRLFATRFKVQKIFDNISNARRDHYQKNTKNFLQDKFEKHCDQDCFEYNAKKYFAKRFLSTCGYVAIFMWIFVVIPWTSLPEIYFFYKIIFAIVISVSSINIFISIVSSYKKCFVYNHGIKIAGLFSKSTIFWEQIQHIVLKDVEIEIFCFDKKKIIIPFQNAKRDHNFLEYLFKPGELLFEKKISDSSSWTEIQNIQKLFKQNNRKIHSDAQLINISANKLLVINKDQLFYLKKSDAKVKIFLGKLPFELFFICEPMWKQLLKIEKAYIKNFVHEYKNKIAASS
ncbi:hypothetical protein [Candidatus Uabimicrobium sp. HlEnr_7]|uniref:hypothetical protein n=1 Tax=Candidatus Uabimicrobium helgolandensis TaxID=3095367 RepID=UPI003558C696